MKHIWIASLLLLSACGDHNKPLSVYLNDRGMSQPTAQSFQTCRAYGCQEVDTITLNKEQWRAIDVIFIPTAKSPRAERKKIANAIAMFEKIIGKKNGTSEDVWGTFQKTGKNQQDCVDESINTSIYLSVLKQRGHIKFHDIESPTSRTPLASAVSWPHQTAVITQRNSKQSFAVDSWFHDNATPPEIIELQTWKKGWKPQARI